MFGGGTARREARAYRKNGLPKRIGVLVDQFPRDGIEGSQVLDIGGGIGGVHHELLRRGAVGAVLVEVSPAYEAAARELARELGHADAVEYRLGDFVALSDEIDPADIVVLDRVVCCYPDMPALVEASAARARRFYLLVTLRREMALAGVRAVFSTGDVAAAPGLQDVLALTHGDRSTARGSGFQKGV